MKDDQELYYLSSIARQYREYGAIVMEGSAGPSLNSEVFGDNLDWLDDRIHRLEMEQNGAKMQTLETDLTLGRPVVKPSREPNQKTKDFVAMYGTGALPMNADNDRMVMNSQPRDPYTPMDADTKAAITDVGAKLLLGAVQDSITTLEHEKAQWYQNSGAGGPMSTWEEGNPEDASTLAELLEKRDLYSRELSGMTTDDIGVEIVDRKIS